MIVTLSGSVRFEREFIKAQRECSRNSIQFFSLAVLPQNRGQGEDWGDDSYDKIVADLLYFDRILRSDAVVVLGDGYVGMSTAREILWAEIQHKPIYAHLLSDDWTETARLLRTRHPPRLQDQQVIFAARRFFKNAPADKVIAGAHTGHPAPFGFDPALDIP